MYYWGGKPGHDQQFKVRELIGEELVYTYIGNTFHSDYENDPMYDYFKNWYDLKYPENLFDIYYSDIFEYLQVNNLIEDDERINYIDLRDYDYDGNYEFLVSTTDESEDEFYVASKRIFLLSYDYGNINLKSELKLPFYKVVKIKPVYLENEKIYIKLELTNEWQMYGFNLYEVVDGEFVIITDRANPSGDGYDALVDNNKNGLYDGFKAYSNSYVFYHYNVGEFYVFDTETNDFILDDTSVDVGDYKQNPGEVVEEYFYLKYLSKRYLENVKFRLQEIYVDFEKHKIPSDIIGERMEIEVDVNETKAIATVTISEYKYTIELIYESDLWKISKITN